MTGEDRTVRWELVNLLLSVREQTIAIWNRLDEGFWDSMERFLIIVGIIFGFYSQVLAQPKIFRSGYALFGLGVTILWMLTGHRKYYHIREAENTIARIEERLEHFGPEEIKRANPDKQPSIWYFQYGQQTWLKRETFGVKLDRRRRWLGRFPSGGLLVFWLPLLFDFAWVALLVFG